MKKAFNFIKKIGSILYDLYITSNRWMHALVGGVIMVVMSAATAIWNPFNPNAIQAIFIGTIATFIVMCAVEYKDKAHGGKFDWKDINAGMLIPIVIDILCVILLLTK